jgi:hypothetical protein
MPGSLNNQFIFRFLFCWVLNFITSREVFFCTRRYERTCFQLFSWFQLNLRRGTSSLKSEYQLRDRKVQSFFFDTWIIFDFIELKKKLAPITWRISKYRQTWRRNLVHRMNWIDIIVVQALVMWYLCIWVRLTAFEINCALNEWKLLNFFFQCRRKDFTRRLIYVESSLPLGED